MEFPIAIVASFLVAASGLHARSEGRHVPTSESRFAAEIAMRFGSISGSLVEEESSNYNGIGLIWVDQNNHDSSFVEPIGTAIGLDGCLLYRLSPRIEAGIAFATQSTNIKSKKDFGFKLSAVLLEDQAIMARLRAMMFAYSDFKFGLEVSAGPSWGTLHRFALAQQSIESEKLFYTALITNYVHLGNKDLEVSGFRYEASAMAVLPFNSFLALDTRVGFHHTSLSPTEIDPLTSYARPVGLPEYPSLISAVGIDFAIGLLASF